MAYTQAQLDALDNAIASGALSVSYEGKSTTFRSLDEMLRVRSEMVASLTSTPIRRTILTRTNGDKGL